MFSMLQMIQILTNWLKKITLVYTSEEKKTIKSAWNQDLVGGLF